MYSVILVEAENAGNIGAVARSMANFGLKELVLVSPKVDHLDGEAIARSKHANRILETAKVADDISGFDLLIATTAKLGSDYNIPRTPITPKDLAEKAGKFKGNMGIVFGREGCGLTNQEIAQCDLLVSIPAALKYPTLNLSHACSIIFYELFRKDDKRFALPKRSEKDALVGKIEASLEKLSFATEEKSETQKKFGRRLISKSFLTKRELYVMHGFFKKLLEKL